jgi:hypothetical protein
MRLTLHGRRGTTDGRERQRLLPQCSDGSWQLAQVYSGQQERESRGGGELMRGALPCSESASTRTADERRRAGAGHPPQRRQADRHSALVGVGASCARSLSAQAVPADRTARRSGLRLMRAAGVPTGQLAAPELIRRQLRHAIGSVSGGASEWKLPATAPRLN